MNIYNFTIPFYGMISGLQKMNNYEEKHRNLKEITKETKKTMAFVAYSFIYNGIVIELAKEAVNYFR